jgi:hypothetical protein
VSGLPVDLRPHDDRDTLLLLDCARASIEPETAERIRARVEAGPNWDRLVALAQRHRLAPLLYAHLSRTCADAVPAPVLEFLREYSQKNSAFVLLLTGQLVRLLKTLEANGITAVAFKGPALALTLYGNVARRQFGDLDILVRPRDVAESARAIEAAGFEPLVPVRPAMRAQLLRHAYVQMFHSAGSRTLVELHWDIAEPHWAIRFDADAMWRRLETLALPGASARVPAAEDLLLLLCIHNVRHDADSLEGLCSIAALVRGTPDLDWDRVWRQAEDMRCRRILEFGLLLAEGLFDVPLPHAAAVPLSRSGALLAMARTAARHLVADAAPPRTWRRQVSFQMRLKDRRADRARYCGRILMSTPEDWAMLRLPRSLAFAYPLVRVLRLARK